MPSAWQKSGLKEYAWTDVSALDNLVLNTNVPKPTDIPAGHNLVRIKAAALNARDMMVLAHDPIYGTGHVADLVPCADGTGLVEHPGQGSPFKPGDRVLISPICWNDWSYDGSKGPLPLVQDMRSKGSVDEQGTLREYAVVADSELIPAPKSLNWEELAAIPAAAGTAFHALFRGPKVIKAGQTVLTQGTGGVSCFAIQLAAAVGATVIATSSSDEKLKKAKALGATHTINYKTHPDWASEVLKVTDGRGADMVVDVAGAKTIQQSLTATAHGGSVSIIGFLSESVKTDLVTQIIFGGKTLYGVAIFTTAMLKDCAALIEEKGIKPAVGSVHDWKDAKAAFEVLAKQQAVGKVVIKVGE